MTEAVIVSTARTPIGKVYRGALNNTEGPTMAGHVIGEAVRRAKVESDIVPSVAWAYPTGGSHGNLHPTTRVHCRAWRRGGRVEPLLHQT